MPLFTRIHSDGAESPAALEDSCAGPQPSACWLIGGGPSLAMLPLDLIRDSPIPSMAVNLAGARLIKPNFWTSYDPTVRFHRSIYLDPGVTKFVHRRRALDLVPETRFKVCDCPNLYFFDRDPQRGFHNFLGREHPAIVDWADSFVQAIDILYRLGFRTLYLAGCELRARPSREQIRCADARGAAWNPQAKLADFLRDCRSRGVSTNELDELAPAPLYHFDEHKLIAAAANTDSHYFRIVQSLRLSQRNLALAGMRLVSVTPHSRLNAFFEYRTVRSVVEELKRTIGNPRTEPTRGLYREESPRRRKLRCPMQDIRPLNWPGKSRPITNPATPQPQPSPDLVIEAEGFEPVHHHQAKSSSLHQLQQMQASLPILHEEA